MGNDQRSRTIQHDDENIGELVHGAIRSDGMAWQLLTKRFGGLVAAIARSHGLNEADVADVAQTVWLRLFEHLDRIRQPERLGGWLATTARHESLRVLKRRSKSTPAGDSTMLDTADDSADPQQEAIKTTTNGVLVELIETLPGHHRNLVRLLMVDPPMSYKEISLSLGIPVGSVGPTRQRCLALLRRKGVSAGLGADGSLERRAS